LLQDLERTVPKAKGAKPEEFIDSRFLRARSERVCEVSAGGRCEMRLASLQKVAERIQH